MITTNKRNNVVEFFLLFLILSLSVPLDPLFTIQDMSVSERIALVKEGSLLRQSGLLCLGGYALITLFYKKKYRVHIGGYYGILIIFFLFWAGLSIFWADNTMITSKRIAALFLTSFGAFALSARFSIKEIIKFAFFGCSMTLLLGLICELILNTFTPLAGDYRFSGVMHMNAQGENCAVLFIVSVFLSIVSKKRSLFFGICGIIAFLFLILTRSRTAAMSGVLVFILGLVLFYPKSFKGIAAMIGFVIIILSLCFIIWGDEAIETLNNAGQYFTTMGRQADEASGSISDRKVIWHECMKYALARPLAGYGFGGFWTPRHIASINAAVGRGVIASSHSNYIELLLDIGSIGALTFISILFFGIKKSFGLFKKFRRDADMMITIQLICFLSFVSMFESSSNQSTIHIFVIYVLISKVAFINDNFYKKESLIERT